LGDGAKIIVDEELGYPHELITEALNQSTLNPKLQYRYRVRLFAALVKQVLGHEKVDFTFQDTDDPVLLVLESFLGKSSIKESTEKIRLELNRVAEDFNDNQIRSSYDKLLRLLKESIFLHIISTESFKKKVLDSQEISNYLNCLDFSETESQAVLSAINLWMNGKKEAIPYAIIFEFTRLSSPEFQNSALYLTYELSVDNTEFRRELLYTHYLLVKKIVNDLRKVVGKQELNDDTLENLFKTALILFYCGYSNSLRLPKEEGIAYTSEVLKRQSLEKSFKDAFD
jgi:hypothetical protein